MKWEAADIQTFIEAREYVDTALVPLYGVSFAGGMSKSASGVEFISIISQQIEKQFKGRLLLMPGITYCHDWTDEDKVKCISQWRSTLKKEKFPHIFFLTVDEEWKLYAEQMDSSLIWTPLIPLENVEEKYKKTIMDEEISNILNIIIRNWKKV